MNKLLMALLAMFTIQLCNAQQANVTWGDEFKIRKGSTDLEVVHADNTGIYVKESHQVMKDYFVIGFTTREAATLIKLDKNLTEIYRQDFNKPLKGKDFESFFFLKDKLYLIGSKFFKKEKELKAYAAEINKENGELAKEWVELASWTKEEKGDDIDFKTTYNSDSTKIVFVSTIEGKIRNNYEIRQLDQALKPTGDVIKLTNEFDPKTFQLEDVLYTIDGNVVLVGRKYEYEEGKKKKAKFLQFVEYSVRLYDSKGTQIKEINTNISAKWLVSTKVLQVPGKDLILAAYYSNEKKGKEINGMLVQRINPATGDIVNTSVKDINTSLITTLEDDDDNDDDDESRSERKERKKLEKIQEDEGGFSKYMRFRNFVFTPDNGIIVLSEKYHHYQYTSYSPSSGGMGGFGGMGRSTTYDVHECGNLMISKIDSKGEINWLHVIPKDQKEVIQIESHSVNAGLSFSMGNSFFNSAFNRPFYAGFGVLSGTKNMSIIYNDHKKNKDVLQLGQKVKRINYYRKSDCYSINLDMMTGKYTRTVLFNNKEVPTAMPRLGSTLGNTLFLIGKEDKMLGKTKIAVARLTLKG